MLNSISNNFPKGCLVRFLADLATKTEKRAATESARSLPRFKREEKLF
jgi:hypothetical protein